MNADPAEEPGWDVGPEDESRPMLVALGRQIKTWREQAGMSAAELGERLGYGEALIFKIESGRRIPRGELLDQLDGVVGAEGKIAAMKQDFAEATYPKKVRELAMLEARAVELSAYGTHNLHGLLQTEEYARALFGMRRPAFSPDQVEQLVAARVARQSIFGRAPAPELSFVQEEVTLRRSLGGRMVLRRQLEHLLELGQLRNVEIQVMPTARDDHAGMGGEMQVLKFGDGSAVGRSEGDFGSRPVSDPKHLRIIELRCGIIRAQALSPGESLAFVEQVLGET
jgi:transcriptional regulator with XRE-family HTH domain